MGKPSASADKRLTMVLGPEDVVRIEKLKEAYGHRSRTPIVRMALHYFFENQRALLVRQGIDPNLKT